MIKEPVIILKFKCQETLKALPSVYIRTFEEAIKVNAHNFDVLEEIRVSLINMRAWVDEYQDTIRLKEAGFVGSRKAGYTENEYE